MTQKVKPSVAQTDNLSLIHRTHMVGQNKLPHVVHYCLSVSICVAPPLFLYSTSQSYYIALAGLYYYVIQDGLNSLVLLPQTHKCWDSWHLPLCLAYNLLCFTKNHLLNFSYFPEYINRTMGHALIKVGILGKINVWGNVREVDIQFCDIQSGIVLMAF